jgi:hypothetical protein
MVSSAKQKAHTVDGHELSQQFLQMEHSGFNAEQNWNESIPGE